MDKDVQKSILANNRDALKFHVSQYGFENVEPQMILNLIDRCDTLKNQLDLRVKEANSVCGANTILREQIADLKDQRTLHRSAITIMALLWVGFIIATTVK